jgi:hypothetical protein
MRLCDRMAMLYGLLAGAQCIIAIAYLAKRAATYTGKHLIFLCSRKVIPNECEVIVIRAARCIADHHRCCLIIYCNMIIVSYHH